MTAKPLRVLLYCLYPVFGNILLPGRVERLNTSPRQEEQGGFPSAKALSCGSEMFKFDSKGLKEAREQKAHVEDAEGRF